MVRRTKAGPPARKIRQNRDLLRGFLSRLDPQIRRWVLGDQTTEDYLAHGQLDPKQRGRWDEAWREYKRLVSLIPEERANFRREHGLLGRAQLSLIGAPADRGAPVKPVEHRSDVRIAKLVERIESRLARGIQLVRRQKRAGGFASGEQQLRRALRQEGYRPKEIDAILSTRTGRSAAATLLAWRLKDRDVDVIQAAVSRGRRLLANVPH